MASYKDPSNIKFNPYVQTLPVEAMAKVGMYKQQRYDQGVEKIQKSIDNIAGLDIVRPEDKKYLQSKLNALGNQISGVAGGDFSNFALVNSVNGMTNQIVKDPGVMNAVSNTARYKKDLANVEKLELEGKWAPSNQAAFQKDVNKWFDNPDSDAKYSSQISPYVDTTKEATTIVKALTKDFTENDVIFDTDSSGAIIGVRDAITRKKIEGITKEKIGTALQAGLSPQAWRQLSIDGAYKYSGTSTDQFISDINLTYQSRFEKLEKDKREYQSMLADVSEQEQTRLTNLISGINDQEKNLKKEYNSISKGFEQGNVDGSKEQYYTMNWLDNMSSSLSSTGQSITYHTSPYKTQDNWERTFQQREDQFKLNYNLKRLAEERAQRKEETDKNNENSKVFGSLDLPVGGEAFQLTNEELIAKEDDNIALSIAAADNAKSEILKIKRDIKTDKEFENYIKNVSTIKDPIKKKLVLNYIDQTKNKQRLLINKENIEKRAAVIAPVPTIDEVAPTLSGLSYGPEDFIIGDDGAGGILYHTISEGDESFNVYELANLISKFKKDYPNIADQKFSDGFRQVGEFFSDGEKNNFMTDLYDAKKELTGLELKLFEQMYLTNEDDTGYKVPDFEVGFSTRSNSSTLRGGDLLDMVLGAEEINEKISSNVKKQNDYIASVYAKMYEIRLPKSAEIDKDNYGDLKTVLGQLSVIANSSDEDDGEGELPTGVSVEMLQNIIENPINSASLYSDTQGTQGVIVDGNRIEIPKVQFDQLTKNQYQPSPSMRLYQDKILPILIDSSLDDVTMNSNNEEVLSPTNFYTTSIDGEYDTNASNAQFTSKGDDFIGLNDSYDVNVNFITDTNPNDVGAPITVQMYVLDPLDMEYKTLYFNVLPENIATQLFGRQDLEQVIYSKLYNTDKPMPLEYKQKLTQLSETVKSPR